MSTVISIIGRSGSGKTTLIEKLIEYFNTKGYRISTIKHLRQEFDMDKPGKDTWRYREAGSSGVAITNDRDYAVISRNHAEMSSVDIAERYFSETDIVIIEGDRDADVPKIEVIDSAREQPLLYTGTAGIVALVSDIDTGSELPSFLRDDIDGIGSFIETTFVKKKTQ